MVFSDTSNLLGLVEDITFLLGNVDTTQYVLKDRARNINERYRAVWGWIFEVYGGWIFDDSNQTDLPQATTTLTSGTAVYSVPTGALAIQGIEAKDSAGNWSVLQPITTEQINESQAVDEFSETNGIPRYYRLVGETIELFPAPNYTQAASLKVYFNRDISVFASTDTTKTPGFAAPFHRALSVGAALDFAMANSMNEKISTLSQMWVDFERRIKNFYSERYLALFPQRIKVRDAYKEYE